MIRAYLRLAPVVLRAVWHCREGQRVSSIRSRVPLSHVDAFGHMNQARYAEHFEMGRTDLLVRSGAWQRWRAQGVYPVVARQEVVYRRELKPLQAFDIDTRAVGLEGRLLHTQGVMSVGPHVHARADVYLIFLGPAGVLSAEATASCVSDLLVGPMPLDGWQIAQR